MNKWNVWLYDGSKPLNHPDSQKYIGIVKAKDEKEAIERTMLVMGNVKGRFQAYPHIDNVQALGA